MSTDRSVGMARRSEERRDASADRRRPRKLAADAGQPACAARGWRSTSSSTARRRSTHAERESYDVVVLDRDIPGVHGDDVCRRLVAGGCAGRILMLTAARSVEDRVEGLGLGADDYLPKPFEFAELVARIRALGRARIPALPPTCRRRHPSRPRPARGHARRTGGSSSVPGSSPCWRRCSPPEGVVSHGGDLSRASGTSRRPLQQGGQDDRRPAAAQARRPAADRDGGQVRLPHPGMSLHLPQSTIRLRLATAIRAALPCLWRGAARRHLPARARQLGRDSPPIRPRWDSRHRAPQAVAADQQTRDLNLLLFWSAIALAVMAVASIGLGWVVAGRILGRLRAITATARTISASNLHERLALEGPDDELKELGDTFDGLLARLESSFEAQRQFVANASHELRTPLTLSRALLQVALADPDLSPIPCVRPARRCSKPSQTKSACSRRSSPSATARPDSRSASPSTLPWSPKTSWAPVGKRRRNAVSRSS